MKDSDYNHEELLKTIAQLEEMSGKLETAVWDLANVFAKSIELLEHGLVYIGNSLQKPESSELSQTMDCADVVQTARIDTVKAPPIKAGHPLAAFETSEETAEEDIKTFESGQADTLDYLFGG